MKYNIQIQQYKQQVDIMLKQDLFKKYIRRFNIEKLIIIIHHDRIREKIHIILIDTENAFDKIQYLISIRLKNMTQTSNRGNFLHYQSKYMKHVQLISYMVKY